MIQKKNKFLVSFFRFYFKKLLTKNFYGIYSYGEDDVFKNLAQKKDIPFVFILNHSNWWDGVLIPYLDLSYFKTNGYCLMEKKQMDKNRFFGKIGAVEIVREKPFEAMRSLDKCISLLRKEKKSLYIFPQGVIRENGVSDNDFKFKRGVEYIIKKLGKVIVVNCLVNYKFVKEQRPEIYLNFFEVREINEETSNKNLSSEEEIKFRNEQKKFDLNYKSDNLSEYKLILKGRNSIDKR